jgi:hypothetical protein
MKTLTTAKQMARQAGIRPQTFRNALRKAKLSWHKHWSRWIVAIGSAKHADMQRVLRSI